jgi:Secretion system C-terminal sorting domain
MKKVFTQAFMAIVLLVSFATVSNAQKVIWPTADSATIRASQFSDSSLVFWERGAIAAPASFTGWTTRGVACGLFPAKKDSAVWRWSRTGKSLGPSTTTRSAINSTTMANGSVMFDSDYLTGTAAIPGAAPADYPQIHSGDLISPIIDATGSKDMTIQFSEYYYAYYENLAIAWSEDGGVTWKDTVDVLPHSLYNQSLTGTVVTGTTTTTIGTFVETIPGDVMAVKLLGSVGTSKFRFKFIFEGDGYFWMVDDVRVLTYQNNMQVDKNWFAIAPNFVTPRNQVEPLNFLSDISNQGSLAQPNVKLTVSINKNSDGSQVYTAARNYGTIKADSIAENELIAGSYTPSTAANDVYIGRYRISSDSTDQYVRNDSARFVFATSDSVFQKETGGAIGTGPASSFWGSATAPRSWKIGNYFFVPKGATSTATKITARIANAASLIGVPVQAVLYEWKQGVNDTFFAKVADLTPLAGGEVIIPVGSANFSYFDFKLEPYTGTNKNIYLKDNTAYIAMLEFSTTALPTAANGTMSMTFEHKYNYGAMRLATRKAGKPRMAAVYGGNAAWGNDFRFDWFGSDYIPVVRLTVVPFRVNTKDLLSGKNSLDVSPNPVTDGQLNLDVALDKQSDMVVRIVSTTGQTLSEQHFDGFLKNQIQVNVNGYVSGTYIAQILTADGILSRRFVVTK